MDTCLYFISRACINRITKLVKYLIHLDVNLPKFFTKAGNLFKNNPSLPKRSNFSLTSTKTHTHMKDFKIKYLSMTIAAIFITHLSIAQEDGSDYHLDKTYPMSKTGKLWMNPEDAKVKIIGSDRSDVHIKIDRVEEVKGFSNSNREFSVDIDSKDGDVFLKEKERKNGYFIGSVKLDYTILVELPQGASLIVRSDDSDYRVTNVNGSIDMSLDDGDAILKQCDGSKFEFDFDDGNVTMDGGNGQIYAKFDDGNIDISNGSFDDVEIKVDDGSILVETDLFDDGSYKLYGDDARIELTIISGGGDIIVDGDDTTIRATGDFRNVDSSEDRTTYSLPGGSAKINIKTDDGRVRIQKSTNKI